MSECSSGLPANFILGLCVISQNAAPSLLEVELNIEKYALADDRLSLIVDHQEYLEKLTGKREGGNGGD